MSQIAIRVENLSKQYHIGSLNGDRHFAYKSLRDTITDAFTSPFRRARALLRGQAYGASEMNQTIWALKDVSFEIKRGEVVGIIGRNGAGKSTLLKILSRITEPTEGQVAIYGRVGSLLEVGTGFHPELTGRENIYLNGAILGMRRAKIERQFDAIVDFSGVERFIDTSVKHYSSGMYLRLAFAVAAHLEPEILLVDEVLAVGDAEFQKKCLGKMGEVAGEGRTVLFVSHNMAAMRSLCQRGILLYKGQLQREGSMAACISDYLSDKTANAGSILSHLSKPHPQIQIDSITINGQENDEVHLSSDVRSLRIEVCGRLSQPMCLEIEARIYDLYESPLAFFSPGHQYNQTNLYSTGKFQLIREMALPIMMHGQYDLTLYLTHPGNAIWVTIRRAVRLHAQGVSTSIRLQPRDYYQGAGWVFLPDVSYESH